MKKRLKKILKGVSRSFFLSLIFLPKRVRVPMSLAFLACKAADTIADTDLMPAPKRLKWIDAYRELFAAPADGHAQSLSGIPINSKGSSHAEAALIQNLPTLMSALENLPPQDWLLIQELVLEVTQGMQIDLVMKSFETEAELEQYIYFVAGSVGRFWTKMIRTHFSFAKNWGEEVLASGEKLGKGLQLVNILRDFPRDLQRGRCYIPKELIEKEDFKPALLKLTEKAKKYLAEAEIYCAHHPWYARRLIAAVRLPARLGLKTLDLLASEGAWLDPAIVTKVSRRQVYQTLLESFLS